MIILLLKVSTNPIVNEFVEIMQFVEAGALMNPTHYLY